MFVNSSTFVNAVKTTSMSMKKKKSEELINYITLFKNAMTILITIGGKSSKNNKLLNFSNV